MGPNAKYVYLYVATCTAINVCIHVMSAAIVHELHTTKRHLCQELPPSITNWSPPRKTLTAALCVIAFRNVRPCNHIVQELHCP